MPKEDVKKEGWSADDLGEESCVSRRKPRLANACVAVTKLLVTQMRVMLLGQSPRKIPLMGAKGGTNQDVCDHP